MRENIEKSKNFTIGGKIADLRDAHVRKTTGIKRHGKIKKENKAHRPPCFES